METRQHVSMNTAKKTCKADANGVIHVDLPVGTPGGEVELLLVWNEPEEPSEQEASLNDLVGLLEGVDLTLATHPTGEVSRVSGPQPEDSPQAS